MKTIDVKARAVMVWLGSLLMCVWPKTFMPDAVRDFVRQPWVVVVLPLAMAGASLLLPVRAAEWGTRREAACAE